MIPSVVRGVRCFNLLSNRRFLIEWSLNDPVESITTYYIYRSTTESGDRGNNGAYVKIGQINSPTTQFIDIVDFTYGVVYYYKVLAVSSSGLVGNISEALPVSDMTFDSFEEEPFRVATITTDSFVTGERVTGTINSINNTFTLSSFFRLGSTAIHLNGIRQALGPDYVEQNDQRTIIFVIPPGTGSIIIADYLKI